MYLKALLILKLSKRTIIKRLTRPQEQLLCLQTAYPMHCLLNRNMSLTDTRKEQSAAKNEIGIHSIRGGTIVGEHEIIFAGHDEIITISHSARSKELFATGAINAALFLEGKPAGLYNMRQLVDAK